VKYPDLPSVVRVVPDSEELPVPRPPENLIFSNDNSDSGEIPRTARRYHVDYDPTFEARCFSTEHHL